MRPQGPVPLAKPVRPKCRGRPPRSSLPNGRWAESFADDLNTRRGIVSGRVALLPRSTEIQPHVARIRPSPKYSVRRVGSSWEVPPPSMPLECAKCLLESTKSLRKHGKGKWNGLCKPGTHYGFIQFYLNFSIKPPSHLLVNSEIVPSPDGNRL